MTDPDLTTARNDDVEDDSGDEGGQVANSGPVPVAPEDAADTDPSTAPANREPGSPGA